MGLMEPVRNPPIGEKMDHAPDALPRGLNPAHDLNLADRIRKVFPLGSCRTLVAHLFLARRYPPGTRSFPATRVARSFKVWLAISSGKRTENGVCRLLAKVK